MLPKQALDFEQQTKNRGLEFNSTSKIELMFSVGGVALTRLGRGGMFAKLMSPNIDRFHGVLPVHEENAANDIYSLIRHDVHSSENFAAKKTKELHHAWPVFCTTQLPLAPSTRRQLLSPKSPPPRGNGDRIGQGKPLLKYTTTA